MIITINFVNAWWKVNAINPRGIMQLRWVNVDNQNCYLRHPQNNVLQGKSASKSAWIVNFSKHEWWNHCQLWQTSNDKKGQMTPMPMEKFVEKPNFNNYQRINPFKRRKNQKTKVRNHWNLKEIEIQKRHPSCHY